MDQLGHYLGRMLEFEERGDGEAAIALGEKIREAFPECREDILLETGKMKFRLGWEKDALLDLIDAYGISRDQGIYDMILEAYLLPNQESFREMYRHNQELLKEYPHYRNAYPEEAAPRFLPVWQDEDLLVCVDIREKAFAMDARGEIGELPKADERYMMLNEMWMGTILLCEGSCHISEPFMDMDIPMYLAYDRAYWQLFLQLYDLKGLMDIGRIVFLIGTEYMERYFVDEDRLLPNALHPGVSYAYVHALNRVCERLQKEFALNWETIEAHYRGRGQEIIENIKSGKPKILFLTSRFSTALQYHARDCREAAKRLGCETELMIERDGLDEVIRSRWEKAMARLKPDIIFRIDHFRFECEGWMPDEAVCITWVQDAMSHIMDKATPEKLTGRDFVLNHFITWDRMKEVGYPPSRMIDAPIVANGNIYKPYTLTEEEREAYGADVCMVGHWGETQGLIEKRLGFLEEGRLKETIGQILQDYCNLVTAGGDIFYTKDEMELFIHGCAEQVYRVALPERLVSIVAEDCYIPLNERAYRQVLADWLIDAGRYRLKLWGNGWPQNPKYKPYAMGPAPNGETLSKILQSTRIVLGNNVFGTGAARAWESMLSGAFYMSNYVPPEFDVSDIRKTLKEGEEIIFFHGRQDLLDKVDYYLEHEGERLEMARRGREAALERMTYDAMMKRVLREVGERLEGLEDGR